MNSSKGVFSFIPIYGIRRHRLLRDGEGITTLIAFCGCPLCCKYCINPNSLLKSSATEYLSPILLKHRVEQDELYYLATGGGITFGGGEPLLYFDFISNFTELCNKKWKINIETSLNVPKYAVGRVIPFVDIMIVDIKDMNPYIYEQYTGHSNEKVVENLKYILDLGYAHKVQIRIPLIPHFNTETDRIKSKGILNEMGFFNIEDLIYDADIESVRLKEIIDVENNGKVICGVLKRIRVAIAESNNIEFTPYNCEHIFCHTGTCPLCEKELIDIKHAIILKKCKCDNNR